MPLFLSCSSNRYNDKRILFPSGSGLLWWSSQVHCAVSLPVLTLPCPGWVNSVDTCKVSLMVCEMPHTCWRFFKVSRWGEEMGYLIGELVPLMGSRRFPLTPVLPLCGSSQEGITCFMQKCTRSEVGRSNVFAATEMLKAHYNELVDIHPWFLAAEHFTVASKDFGSESEVMCFIMANFPLWIAYLFWRVLVRITESFSSHISHFGINFSPALVACLPCRIVDCNLGKNFRFDVS